MKGRIIKIEVQVIMYPDELGSSEYVMEVIKREAGDCFSEFRLRLIEEKEIEIK